MQRDDVPKHRPDHIVKIMVLGSENSGKTELMDIYAGECTQDVGSGLRRNLNMDDVSVELFVYRDPTYQSGLFAARYRIICAHQVHAIMLIVDMTKQNGLEIAKSILAAYQANYAFQHLKVLVAAIHKSDIDSQISLQQLSDLVSQINVIGYEVIDLKHTTGTEVAAVFEKLARAYLEFALQEDALEWQKIHSLEENKRQNRCIIS